MKNIKLSVLALTVFAATVVSASGPVAPKAPGTSTNTKPAAPAEEQKTAPAATQAAPASKETPKAPEAAPVEAQEQKPAAPAAEAQETKPAATQAAPASKEAPKSESTAKQEAVKAGYFAQAYEATKNGVNKLCSTVKENKWTTAGVVVAVAVALAYRKQISAAAKKAVNYAVNNPVKVAAGAAAIAALGFAEYKLGYGAAALDKVTSLFSSKAASDAVAKVAPVVKQVTDEAAKNA